DGRALCAAAGHHARGARQRARRHSRGVRAGRTGNPRHDAHRMTPVRDLLSTLRIGDTHAGACTGREWLSGGSSYASVNPATGEPIANVLAPDIEHYERVMSAALSAWDTWRTVPGPARGEV